MTMRTLVLAIGLAAFLIAGPAHAVVAPDAACKDTKAKGAGKKAFDLLKAFGKNLKKPNTLKLAQDVSKAESGFTKFFNRADAQGGCRTVGDAEDIEMKVNLLVCRLVDSVMPSTCGNNCAGVGEECDGTDAEMCPTQACIPAGEPDECTCQGCGDGILGSGEQCDEGAANGTADSCCTVDCTLKPASTTCTDTDGNVCTTAGCNGTSGQCEQNHVFAPGGTACPDTDGNVCTTAGCNGAGSCDQNHTSAPSSTTCPDTDGNVCTTAGCNGVGACDQGHVLAPLGASCDADGEECTVDRCNGLGSCVLDFNVPASDPCTDTDGDLCTTAGCDGAGSCDQNHIVVSCNPPIDPDCDAGETCNPATGLCETNYAAASTPCPDTDGNVCTTAGCDGLGSCDQTHISGPSSPCPDTDGNDCTTAGCDDFGVCDQLHVLVPNSTPCTDLDGDLCTLAGCDGAGTCDQNHGAVSCNGPGDPECDPIGQTCNPATGLCEDHFTADSTPCTDSDANVCTTAGCDAGVCDQSHILEPVSTSCDAGGGGSCSSDHCNGAGTCVSESDCCAGLNCTDNDCDLLSFETGIASGVAGVLRNLRCSNASSSACMNDNDCDVGPCYITPPFCAGNLAVPCTDDSDCEGTCAEVSAGNLPLDLALGGLYTGGGLNSVPLPFPVPDQGLSYTKVVGCDSGTGVLTLGAATPAEVGMRHCSQGRTCTGGTNDGLHCVLADDCPGGTCTDNCVFGPPLPIPNPGTPATSVCAMNVIDKDASGTSQCDGGGTDISSPLRSVIFLNGDLFKASTPPDIPGVQPCPICVPLCQGGTNDGWPCRSDNPTLRCSGGDNDGESCTDPTDCPGGGTCTAASQELTDCTSGGGICPAQAECLGGPNDGDLCTAATSDSSLLSDSQDAYPTSHDCANDPLASITDNIGGLPVGFGLTSGTIEWNAVDRPSGKRNFCGFCRDVSGAGSLCFEGSTNPGCPAPGGGQSADGNANPCESDADCDDGDEYESCVQRDPGAFGEAAATRIRVWGQTDGGCLGDGAPHAANLVSIFCVPPTFDATVDAAGDLPGPGAALLSGDALLE